MTLVDIEAPPEVRRDRWGRYAVLPLEAFAPDGTVMASDKLPKLQGMQRATTLKSMIEDTSNLTGWACRMTLIGAAARQDIIASALAAGDDRTKLNTLVEQAKEAGGATVRRDLGTAIHKFLELACADPTYAVPEPYTADVAAILAAIDDAGFDIVTEFSEKILVVDSIGVAGMCDLVLRDRTTGDLFIADLKTGSSVKYGVLGFCCQLTTYSMADAIYEQGAAADGSDDRRLPMPPVSRTTGFIIHCQPGSGHADLYQLTLDPEVVNLAVAVREIRKRRDLLTKFEGGGTDVPPGQDTAVHPAASVVAGSVEDNQPPAAALAILHETRVRWLINRATHLAEKLSKKHVGEAWPVDVAPPLHVRDGNAKWTSEDIDAAARALDALEAKHDVPFGHEDPATTAARREQLESKVAAEVEHTKVTPAPEPPVDGAPFAPADAVRNLLAIVKSMAADDATKARIQRVQHWQTQGTNKRVPWKIGNLAHDKVPERLFAIVAAAVGCLDLIDLDAADPDAAVRDLLGVVLEDHDLAQQPSHPVGALFGLLTTEQALRLADMAETATQEKETRA